MLSRASFKAIVTHWFASLATAVGQWKFTKNALTAKTININLVIGTKKIWQDGEYIRTTGAKWLYWWKSPEFVW